MPKLKNPTTKQLEKMLWRRVSEYIRKRDNYICFTCGARLTKNTSEAGHFLHQAKTSKLAYDERLLRCQCTKCNKWLSGNLVEYSIKMINLYGIEQINEWRRESKKVYKWKQEELKELIDKYDKLLNNK